MFMNSDTVLELRTPTPLTRVSGVAKTSVEPAEAGFSGSLTKLWNAPAHWFGADCLYLKFG